MRIAVTGNGPTLDDQVDPRFGRCAYFLIVETETMAFEAVENPNVALGGGAGIQSAQLISDHDAKYVLTGNCGPNAFQTLQAADIQVVVGASGPVRQAVERFTNNAFSAASDPNVTSHFGMGSGASSMASARPVPQRGAGRGMGRGMGRGRGMGQGMGAGMPGSMNDAAPGLADGETELEHLRVQAQAMQEQLRSINTRISQVGQRVELCGLMAVVDPDNCNACGICRDICPVDAIVVDNVVDIDTAKCDGCGRCVAQCPQAAMSLRPAR